MYSTIIKYFHSLAKRNPPENMNPPDFIIIGAQKSGTTALAHNLSQHPHIYMPPDEINFFNRDVNWRKGVSWYSSLFQQTDKIQGEKTPNYLPSEKARNRMAETLPNVKLIILLRNPIDRAYSQWNHYNQILGLSQNWGWRKESFETIVSLAEQKIPPFSTLINQGKYFYHIKDLLNDYPRELLFIGIAERFKQDRSGQLNLALDFLGAERMNLTPEIIHERTYAEPMNPATRAHLENLFKPFNKRLFDFLGEEVKEWKPAEL